MDGVGVEFDHRGKLMREFKTLWAVGGGIGAGYTGSQQKDNKQDVSDKKE